MKIDSLAAVTLLLVQRLDELGRISDEKGKLTRTFLSPAMQRANALVARWMREAGLTVREDAAGNLCGRLEPRAKTTAKTLLLGSHLDTVRNAGRFDGALGVMLPIVALTWLRQQGIELPFAVEVVGFSEEEAVRFPTAYIGSKAYAGRLRARELATRDSEGRTLRDFVHEQKGSELRRLKPAYRAGELLGYIEVHIEQGPVLEAKKLAAGIVSAIASQTRGQMIFHGRAGHAGTTPMAFRRDALAGAAEFVQYVEKFARADPVLVGTVGRIEVPGGAANVIPGQTFLSLDVRHPDETQNRRAVAALIRQASAIARRRGLRVSWRETMRHGATLCSPELNAALGQSVKKFQGQCPALVSGAGHDAVVMAELTRVAMLFVRCRAGLSHHPDEYAAPRDLRVALAIVTDFLPRLASTIS